MSGNSWANMGQECIKCHINVYPHKQVSRVGWDLLGKTTGGRLFPYWASVYSLL